MRPTSLRPGDRVQLRGSQYLVQVVRLDPGACARPVLVSLPRWRTLCDDGYRRDPPM